MHRRTATKIKNGRVQHKNRWTRPINTVGPLGVTIERARPCTGYTHAVTQDELYSFLHNLTDWPSLSEGLNRIVLDGGWRGTYGQYCNGTIMLCAFESDLTVSYPIEKRCKDREFFEPLAIDIESYFKPESDRTDDLNLQPTAETDQHPPNRIKLYLTSPVARAFMLVHVLCHELGHHLDLRRHHQRGCLGGEPFAYRYEWNYADHFWQTYLRIFGHPLRER